MYNDPICTLYATVCNKMHVYKQADTLPFESIQINLLVATKHTIYIWTPLYSLFILIFYQEGPRLMPLLIGTYQLS
jgi:hypothetical protein